MKAANISPTGTAAFFRRMDKSLWGTSEDGKGKKAEDKVQGEQIRDLTSWFASHPSSKSRYELFENAAVKGHEYAPALTPAQWDALRGMCVDDRDVKSDFGFGF